MKLSEHTVSVLKNFASINQNLIIKKGKTLTTMSAMKNIIASASVEEDFPKEIALYDLNEFLASLSLRSMRLSLNTFLHRSLATLLLFILFSSLYFDLKDRFTAIAFKPTIG